MNRKKINWDCFKLQPSAKLYEHKRTQIPLVKFHIHATLNIFIKHRLQRSLEAVCAITQGPRVLHKQLTQSKADPAQRRGILAKAPFQQQQPQRRRPWRGALINSEPAYARPAQSLPPSACRQGNSRGTSAKCPASHTQTLSRSLLLYSLRSLPLHKCQYWSTALAAWWKYWLWLQLSGLNMGSDVNVLYKNV